MSMLKKGKGSVCLETYFVLCVMEALVLLFCALM